MKPRISFSAHLRLLSMLNSGPFVVCGTANPPPPSRALAQVCPKVDMAYDILKKARSPLHVSHILERIQTQFGVTVDRESLVSSLSKKVARGDRFLRPDKNTFALRPEAR